MIINGLPATELNIADRAIQYGDGCFTTMAVRAGKVRHWQQHLHRLQHAANILAINFSPWQELQQQVMTLALATGHGVIKIILSRGISGRGYAPGKGQGTYILTVHEMPQHYATWQSKGVKLGISSVQIAKQPLLAGIKHLNRLEQVLVKQSFDADVFDDVLVCDTDGMLVETSIGNLFWRKGPCWFTPDLYFCGVEGVMRNLAVAYFKQIDQPVQQIRTKIGALRQADEVFVCNSLMGLVPVACIEDTAATSSYVIEDYQQLQQQLNKD
jgi:4-amino-4-deoxychorismate lyase